MPSIARMWTLAIVPHRDQDSVADHDKHLAAVLGQFSCRTEAALRAVRQINPTSMVPASHSVTKRITSGGLLGVVAATIGSG